MKTRKAKDGRPDRVILYYRNSHEQQEASIERQQSQLEPYAANKGWNIVARLEDPNISSNEIAKRQKLQIALAMASRGEIDGIAVDDLDRLMGLDMLEAGELLSPLRRAGVWIESVSQGRFDYNSMSGRLMIGVTSERKYGQITTTSRMALAQHLRKAKDLGEPVLPKPAYGYRRVPDMEKPLDKHGKQPGKLVIEPGEAEVVMQIFTWYAEGYTVGWICAELRRRAVLTASGKYTWHRATVRCMLDNPAYVGDRAWGKTAGGKHYHQEKGSIVQGNGERCYVKHEPADWIVAVGINPQIVPRDLWQRVQARRQRGQIRAVQDANGKVLRTEGEASTPCAVPGEFILSKLLVCGRCGAWLTGFHQPNAGKAPAYVCATYAQWSLGSCVRCEVVEKDALEDLVGQLRQLLASDRQEMLRKRLKEEIAAGQTDKQLATLRKRVSKLSADLVKYKRRLLEVKREMVPLVEEGIEQCNRELREAQDQLDKIEKSDPVRDLAEAVEASGNVLWSLEQALAEDNRVALREALLGVVAKLTIEPAPYLTTTGRTRHRPGLYKLTLKRGTGLDILAELDGSQLGPFQVLQIDLAPVA